MTFRPRAYERGGGLPVFPMIEVIHLALAGARPRDTRPGWSANKDSEFSSLRKEEYRRRTTVRSGSAAGRRQPRISDRYCSEPGKIRLASRISARTALRRRSGVLTLFS